MIATTPWLESSPDARGDVIALRGARVLDPRADLDRTADLLVAGGEIAEIAEPGTLDPPPEAEVIDAQGLCALPAFFDCHVHLRTPGREDEEDIESGTRAAAAGGFGAVVAMPNTDPVVDTRSVLESLRAQAREKAHIPTGFLAAITRGQVGDELTEMADLVAGGALGFTDDGRPVHRADVMRQALQYQRMCQRPLCLHAEEPLLSQGTIHEGTVSAALGLSGIPSIAESTMVLRDIAICAYEQGSVHIQHLSAAESVAAIEEAKQRGVSVTAEVTPHHLALTEEELWSLDSRFKMNPPLRSAGDRMALVDGLRSGVIDCVATDHAPHSSEEKQQPLELSPMGVTGLETAFAALYTELCEPGLLPLSVLVERMTAGAQTFGLPVFTISPGASANVCLVDLDARWEVGSDGYESRSQNCAFSGRTLRGKVCVTIARGSVCYREPAFAMRQVSA